MAVAFLLVALFFLCLWAYAGLGLGVWLKRRFHFVLTLVLLVASVVVFSVFCASGNPYGGINSFGLVLGSFLSLFPWADRLVGCQRTGGAKGQVEGALPEGMTGGSSSPDTKKCPACAELIKAEAAVCRFCGRTFSAQEVAAAVDEHQTQIRARELVAQEAEFAEQQQRELNNVRGRRTRRLVFGIILTLFGGFVSIAMVFMFCSTPQAGTTLDQQRTAAVTTGIILGLIPLLLGFALLHAAKLLKTSLGEKKVQPVTGVLPRILSK